jgi:hypothetical protein
VWFMYSHWDGDSVRVSIRYRLISNRKLAGTSAHDACMSTWPTYRRFSA